MAVQKFDGARLGRSGKAAIANTWPALLFFLALIGLWEVSARAGWVPEYILPAPTKIGATIERDWLFLLDNTWITLYEIIMGFVIGSLMGFVLGLGVVYVKALERIIYPTVVFMQTIPKLALAPLFIVWFGVGVEPKIAIAALICLFPVLINTVAGIKSVDPRLHQLMNSISATKFQIFRKVDLPTAMPSIFASLEVGITLAVVGALVGEWVGADQGLGYLILYDNALLRTPELFADLVFVAGLGILLFLLTKLAEYLLLPHRPGKKTS